MGDAGGKDPVPAEGPLWGRGMVTITVGTNRLEGTGRPVARPHLSRCETWPRVPGERCLRGRSCLPPFSQRIRGSPLPPIPLSGRGLAGPVVVVCPLLSLASTPSTNFPFFPSLFFPLWMGNHRLRCQARCEELLPVPVGAPPRGSLAASAQPAQDIPGPRARFHSVAMGCCI